VSLLDRKLLRDLNAMRGQVLSIALLVAAGVAVFVGSVSTYDSLRSGVDRFYATSRFPQIFVALKRAPLSIVPRLNAVIGVAAVEPRIVREVIVDWPAASQPVSARMVSLSHAGDENLSRLHLRRGAAPEPGSARSAAVNEAFAERRTAATCRPVGVVQKVSNLILNINVYLRDAHTGHLVTSMSVDFRGNTDES
jgi:putative ABC transport system permease protein